MIAPKRDLTGQVFGRLTVVGQAPRTVRHPELRWECVCVCGERTITKTSLLTTGKVRSCGCLRGDTARARLAASRYPTTIGDFE